MLSSKVWHSKLLLETFLKRHNVMESNCFNSLHFPLTRGASRLIDEASLLTLNTDQLCACKRKKCFLTYPDGLRVNKIKESCPLQVLPFTLPNLSVMSTVVHDPVSVPFKWKRYIIAVLPEMCQECSSISRYDLMMKRNSCDLVIQNCHLPKESCQVWGTKGGFYKPTQWWEWNENDSVAMATPAGYLLCRKGDCSVRDF